MTFGGRATEQWYRDHGRDRIERVIADTLRAHKDSGVRVGAGYVACTCGDACDYSLELHQAEKVLEAIEADR